MSYLDAYLGKRGNFGSLVMPVIRNFFLFLALLLPSIGVAQSTICGDVFLDQNKSKFKDSDELARANHAVYLMNFTLMNLGQGGFDTTVTDNNGHYCFVLGNTGSYSIFTDIPENMTLISPIEAVGAMPPYSVQVANMNQKIVVNFGLMGTVAEPIWGKCQDGTEDKSVCVHNSEYLMQVTPNNDATTVKPMEVKQESGVYRGNNEAADVVVGELGTRAARNTRDGAVLDELFFTVGKELSNTGKAIKLNAQINRDGSHSFIDPENPTVKATSNPNGSYTVVDSASPSVSATLDASGNMTVLDSEDSTKSLSVDGATGKVKVVDSDYLSSIAEINPDGSYTVTDAEFPTLIATVYANNEYVVQDTVNNVVIHIDTSGDYTIVDNNTKTCIVLPSDRASRGKLFGFLDGVFDIFKSVVNTVARFINKIAGFVSGIARFVAKVAPIISMAFRVVAAVAMVASVVFPAACPLFCAVAAFAQQAALISDQVGMFANTVANIADGIRQGGILGGFWSGNSGCLGGRRGLRDSIDSPVVLRGEVSTQVEGGGGITPTLFGNITMGICRLVAQNFQQPSFSPAPEQPTTPTQAEPISRLINVTVTGSSGLVTSSPAGINCESRNQGTCSSQLAGTVTISSLGNNFLGWEGGCSGTSPICLINAEQTPITIKAKFKTNPQLPLSNNQIRGYQYESYLPNTNKFGKVRWDSNGNEAHPNKFHSGWDLVAKVGTPVYAIADGKIAYVYEKGKSDGTCSGYGTCVAISFDLDGDGIDDHTAFYSHLSTVTVHTGDNVKKGQEIAATGNTDAEFLDKYVGEAHLHFEIRKVPDSRSKNDAYDPRDFYRYIPPDEPDWKKMQIDVGLNLTDNGFGKVISTPEGIDCSTGQSCPIHRFTGQVTLTATPNNRNMFRGWSGVASCEGSESPTCVITANNTLTMIEAKFHLERCFGGVGKQCDGVPTRPTPTPNAGGQISLEVSVGSIQHDTCCLLHPLGYACQGYGTSTADEGKFCRPEWDKAASEFLLEFGWTDSDHFGPYNPNEGDDLSGTLSNKRGYGELPATLRLAAPSGSKLGAADAAYCASGHFIESSAVVQQQGYGTCSGIVLATIP